MALGRKMNGCGQCVKYGMFISNLLIFLGGATVFGIGLWALIDTTYVNELLGTNLYSGAIIVLVISSLLVCVLSFFGCIGAARQVKCMLLTVSLNNQKIYTCTQIHILYKDTSLNF